MGTTKRMGDGCWSGSGWVRPWMQLVEIAWSAPVVIAYRTARMVTGGWPPTARDRREYTRMVQEKAEAFSHAAAAAVAATVTAAASSTPPTDAATALGDVLAPVHQRVRANRRRLTRG